MDKGDASDVEDGEIVDYTPIPRPLMLVSKACDLDMKYSDNSEEENETEDSDSDSDSSNFRAKRPKLKNKHIFSVNVPDKPKHNKYNVWCADLHESALTDELVNCDVRHKALDRSRDVESYDYSLAYGLNDRQEVENDVSQEYGSGGCKRRHAERVGVKQRLGRRPSADNIQSKGPSRFLLDLKVTPDDTTEEVARDIATKLCEQKEDLILRVVEVLGKQKAMDIFFETKKIEEDGGMLIMNGSRRRTPGGVYLLLIKRDDDIAQDKQQLIFVDDRRAAERGRKRSAGRFRKLKAKDFERSLSPDITLSERNLPALLTHAELTMQKIAEGNREKRGEADGEASVTNPPPSPATDGEQLGDDRHVTSYEDDYLDIVCDNMDLF